MLAVVSSLSLGVALSPAVSHGRKLSQIPIGKYAPSTNVLDHANIDLDQMTLEAAFGSEPYDFAAPKAAWQGAGYSKVTATCTLAADAATAVAVDDKISYTGADGAVHLGTATAATATTEKAVVFKTAVVQDNRNSRVDTTAVISINAGATIGTCATVTYVGGRTLAGFSTGAKAKMLDCAAQEAGTLYANGCPYTSYKPYYDYYCASETSACNANGDYVNQWVLAAADETATGLDAYNIDFSTGTAKLGPFRKDFLKKVSKFAGAYMYALREFEDAIDDCTRVDLTDNAYSDGSVHAWDEGVAFYVGGQVTANMFYDSVTGEEKAPETSHYLSYTLANKRCTNFKTCGRGGDMVSGEAYINYELWKVFGEGRDQILAGNCAGAVPVKDEIVKLANVPLVQGSLRYAYFCRSGVSCSSKALGELAAFVASILPVVHACSPAHAATLASAADPAAFTCADDATCTGGADYSAVKSAFESCYSDMGITCAQVGGLYDANEQKYEAGAGPCSDASNSSDELGTNAIIGIAIGAGVAVIALLGLLFVVCKERSGKPLFTPLVEGGAKPAKAKATPTPAAEAKA